MNHNKCFACGKNPQAPGKTLCAECIEKYPPQPYQPGQPDWDEDGSGSPFSSIFDDDIESED